MSKLLKALTIAGAITGAAIMSKGCVDDFNYETKMIKEDRTEEFAKKGTFKDTSNGFEYIAGLGLLGLSLYGLSKSGSQYKKN